MRNGKEALRIFKCLIRTLLFKCEIHYYLLLLLLLLSLSLFYVYYFTLLQLLNCFSLNLQGLVVFLLFF